MVGPNFRSSHAMAYDSQRGRTVLFGGFSPTVGQSEFLADTWEYDGTTWTQRATTGPTRCQNAVAVFDSARNRTVLFGGLGFDQFNGPTLYRETWEWNGSSWTNRQSYGPDARYLHSMAYDTARGRVVMFGGITSAGLRDPDTWEFDGTSWTRRATTGPSPRYGHSMAFDPSTGRVVLFGGYGGTTVKQALGDTWTWNGTSWTLASNVGPSARMYHAMAFDQSRGTISLLGGRTQGGDALADAWEWSGSQWQAAGTDATGARESFAMVFDAARNRLFAFGGWGPRGRFADSWERSGSGNMPTVSLEPADRISPIGTSTTFRVDVSGTGPFQFQWRRNGVNLSDGGRFSGTRSAVFTINGIASDDNTTFDCVVSNACGTDASRAAWLRVRCPADLDNGGGNGVPDQGVDVNDLIFFIRQFEAGDVRADVDDGSSSGFLDQGVDINDLIYFLRRFELGC